MFSERRILGSIREAGKLYGIHRPDGTGCSFTRGSHRRVGAELPNMVCEEYQLWESVG